MSVTQDKNDNHGLSEVVPMALRYEAGRKSSVITQRSTIKYYPTTGTQIKSTDAKTSIFRLSASDFLDPRTTCLQFRLSVGSAQIRMEDLYTSLIQSITCVIGGVETSHVDNFGEAFKMVSYATCPESVYKHQWNATMGAWKYVPRARFSARQNQASHALDLAGDGQTGVQLGWVMDDNSYPMLDRENHLYTDWNATGKRGVTVSIPLAEILGEFRMKQFLPLLFLGSIDITIQWANIDKACIFGQQFTVDADKDITVANTAIAAEDQYYQIDDLCVHTDLVTLDPTYTKLLQGLVSSSPQGLVMPYESYTTFNRSFRNSGGMDSIYLSKGVSYLKRMLWAIRPMQHVANRYVDKSNFKFADAHIAHQTEVGGRLFPENRVTDLATCYVELQKACDQQGSVDAGGIINEANYTGRYPGGATYQSFYIPEDSPAAPVTQPHRELPQCFIMGQNFERALGSGGLLSGLNLKVSGYSILLNLELKQSAKTGTAFEGNGTRSVAGDAGKFDPYREPNAYFYNQQLQLLAVMHMDKSLVLRADAVSVSE